MAAIVDHSIGDNMQDPFKEVAVLEHLLAAHSIASNKPNFDSIENSHSCSFGIITNLRQLVPSQGQRLAILSLQLQGQLFADYLQEELTQQARLKEPILARAASIDILSSTMNIIGYSSHDIIADRRVKHHPPLQEYQVTTITIRNSILKHHTKADLWALDMLALEPGVTIDAYAYLLYHLLNYIIIDGLPVSYLLVCLNYYFLDSSNHTMTIQ